ncbi:MAG: DUF4127 family protein [Clostridia bacterium]|nr:DUF4127 family protein [Clostridia bacterium]
MKVIYIPLDERPCNYYFAGRIAEGTEVELIAPRRDALGDKKTPADFDRLKEFLLENAAEADSLVISIDMLLYGGIVPSRLHHLTEDELDRRLSVISEIKRINPKARVYAFALIMRCPKYSSSDEEPDYYEHCGEEIFRTGQIKHKKALGLIGEAEADELLSKYASVTGEHLSDFEHRREINRNMLIKVVKMLGNSIDFLIIPQDDSAEFGYTSMDREAIKDELSRSGLSLVAMYPGADEVGMTLLARAACDYKGVRPKIYCHKAHKDCLDVTPLYEDRPLGKTLPHQVESAGCVLTESEAGADIQLFLNYPAKDPVEVFEDPTEGYAMRDLDGFTNGICRSIGEGRVTALADGAYCNGGDRQLLSMLAEKTDLLDLSAYAGWNTSSNTLGTVICQAVFVLLFGDGREEKRFLAERIYEDVGYCGFVRSYVTKNILPSLGYNYFDAGCEDGIVADKVREALDSFIGSTYPDLAARYEIDVCRMPWRRMFEVDLSLKER